MPILRMCGIFRLRTRCWFTPTSPRTARFPSGWRSPIWMTGKVMSWFWKARGIPRRFTGCRSRRGRLSPTSRIFTARVLAPRQAIRGRWRSRCSTTSPVTADMSRTPVSSSRRRAARCTWWMPIRRSWIPWRTLKRPWEKRGALVSWRTVRVALDSGTLLRTVLLHRWWRRRDPRRLIRWRIFRRRDSMRNRLRCRFRGEIRCAVS